MDAMIHNLNKSRYLINSKVDSLNYFSENYAQALKCNDTEFMKVNFENGACSYLFITWAGDLEVYSLEGNEREHYGILHMITHKGWYLTEEEREDGKAIIRARKEHEIKEWEVNPLPHTPYDEVSLSIQRKEPQKYDMDTAVQDIKLLELAAGNLTVPVSAKGV